MEMGATYLTLRGFDQRRLFIFFVYPIFIINPTVGLLIATLIILRINNSENLVTPYIILLALWISLLNITKIPVSDQLTYQEKFADAFNNNFFDWWKSTTGGSMKEPLFFFFTYVCSNLFGGYDTLYFFVLSFINYIILFRVIQLFNIRLKTNVYFTLAAIISITFFTQYFTLTLHIVRQILACTLAIEAIVLKSIDGKNRYLLLLMSVLFHTSLIFLVMLSFIPWFYNKLKIWQIICICSVLGSFVILFGTLGSFLLSYVSSDTLSYGLSRMTDNAKDATAGINMLGAPMLVCIPLVFISLKLLVYDLPRGRYSVYVKGTLRYPLYPICYIFLILVAFVLSMSKAPLIQYRFFFMIYPFIPFILPYFLNKQNRLCKLYLGFVSIFFIVRFIAIHNGGEFSYATLNEFAVMPIIYYFM